MFLYIQVNKYTKHNIPASQYIRALNKNMQSFCASATRITFVSIVIFVQCTDAVSVIKTTWNYLRCHVIARQTNIITKNVTKRFVIYIFCNAELIDFASNVSSLALRTSALTVVQFS